MIRHWSMETDQNCRTGRACVVGFVVVDGDDLRLGVVGCVHSADECRVRLSQSKRSEAAGVRFRLRPYVR